MLPPPPTRHFAQQNNTHSTESSFEANATLLVLPSSHCESSNTTSPGEAIQRPTEPPIYIKQLEAGVDWRATGILHDFNNQLAIILSHCSIALTKLPTDSNARSNLERSIRATKRAADLSAQLQLGTAAQADELTGVDFNVLVREAVEDLEPRLCAHATLHQAYATNLPLLSANRALLHRAFLNVLLNAANAMVGYNGAISVRTEKVIVRKENTSKTAQDLKPGVYLLFEVHDEGEGMAQEVLDRIFEPYFSTKVIGAGIGLTMVHHIIELHHGTIYIRSKAKQGTIFQILFPVDHGE